MRIVVDASVALKWYLKDRPEEQYVEQAIKIGDLIESGGLELFAPPHWQFEVIAVLARLAPHTIDEAIVELPAMCKPSLPVSSVLRRAAGLAIRLNHHLFDTLYHAVALDTGATLVTANERYFAKASSEGHIVMLRDFKPPAESPRKTT